MDYKITNHNPPPKSAIEVNMMIRGDDVDFNLIKEMCNRLYGKACEDRPLNSQVAFPSGHLTSSGRYVDWEPMGCGAGDFITNPKAFLIELLLDPHHKRVELTATFLTDVYGT